MVAKFLPYLKAHRWQVAWALAQVFLIAGFELLKPWPLQIVIDYVLGGKPPPGIAPLDPLFSLPAPLLLLVACIGLVILNLGAGALTLLALTIVPILFGLISAFNRKIVEVATEVRDADARVYSLVQWGIAAIKVVQAFTKEEEEHRRFMGASRESLRATLRLYNWQT